MDREELNCSTLQVLDKAAIIAIDKVLAAGYDAEVRKNIHGSTVASVGKKVVYKGNAIVK